MNVGTTDRYLFFGTGSDILPNTAPGGGAAGGGTSFSLYGLKDDGDGGRVVFTRALAGVTSSPAADPTNGERPTNAPAVAGDAVFFTTTTGSSDTCGDASTKVYAFTYAGTAAYDSSGNGKMDVNESPVVVTAAGRAAAPFVADQHLVLGTTTELGPGVTLLGDPQDFNHGRSAPGLRMLSWREVR
jgi:hypothetical protein